MGCVEFITAYILSQLQNGARAGLSFLQNQAAERVLNLINLGKNANSLAQEVRQLRDVRDDLVREVELEEIRPRMKRTLQVAGWIETVDKLEDKVRDFLASFEGRRTFLEGCSFEVVYSNCELGQKAALQLGQVRDLRSQRGSLGGELVMEGTPDAVVAVPSSSARIVGGERILSEIRDYLKEDGVGIIGIYGMGGVGKTTCLAEINNELLKAGTNNDFQVTIWVDVTKDNVNISKIQEDISVRLGFSRPGQKGPALPENEKDRWVALYQALNQRRFLLLLDDVWVKLDLWKIGIPRDDGKQSKSKVVFTTRSEKICDEMEAQRKVKVNVLDAAESWELFSSKVGEKVKGKMNTSLQPLAKVVVGRCGGLPLALSTVGRAMAGAESNSEWEDAMKMLTESPGKFENMEDEVLSILKFSFEKLKHDYLRDCLLYCSLYPEDYVIDTEELIEKWVGEGFLYTGPPGTLDTARIKGRQVIRSLKAACLLESGGTENRADSVKMHDVVRKMAVWLTNGEHENGMGIFMVDPYSEGSFLVQSIDRWERAKRISVVSVTGSLLPTVKLPSQVPTCPNLETLFIRKLNIKQLVKEDSVFKFMPALRVLDLSHTVIERLPKDIGLLTGLQYLNLEHTMVRSLPIELGKLVNLRQLNLRHAALQRISGEAILGLTQLQMLNIFENCYRITVRGEIGVNDGKEVTLNGMECSLERLEELGIDIMSSASLEKLVTSNRFSKCARFLRLQRVSDLSASQLSMVFERLVRLRELTLRWCAGFEELRFGTGCQLECLESLRLVDLGHAMILTPPPCSLQRLCKLYIRDSHGFKDLTWIQYLPCLETVMLYDCNGLEELLRTEKGEEGEACSSSTQDTSFPSMKVVRLYRLPNLRIISEHPLLLPSLESLTVSECPELKKLPLGTRSAKKLRMIRGPQKWWDGLEWGQDSSIKDIFLDRFSAW